MNKVTKKPGEVAVNSLDALSEFERKGIILLRHADLFFSKKDSGCIPLEIEGLLKDKKSRTQISDLITILATHYRRPIVRHQPCCNCVGADENVFSNLIVFSGSGQLEDAMLLGSLLVKSRVVAELVHRAALVADLFERDLNENKCRPEMKIKKNYQVH